MENKSEKHQKDKATTEREYHSPINGVLKVRWEKGKKILDTEHTNYSYGSLEDVLNYGLDNIPLENVNSVLLLGMGGGCMISSLKNRYNCQAPVTAIELDPMLIDIAEKEFGVVQSKNLSILETDAYQYITETKDSSDLIIIDIFIDLLVPEKFYKPEFWNAMTKVVNLNGFVLFNTGIDLTEEQVNDFLDTLPDCFLYQVMFEVFESNTLIILNKFSEE